MQFSVEVHEIPNSSLIFAPVGLGVSWMAHFVPFQLSAKVTMTPELLT